MIPLAAQQLIARFPLGQIATITPEGLPAVSPKGTFLVLDAGTLAFANIRSPGTLRNLAQNPACETGFVDPLLRKGWRIAGSARILRKGAEFDALIPRWHQVFGPLIDRASALVLITAQSCSEVITPPYDDGATEAEMIAFHKAKIAQAYP